MNTDRTKTEERQLLNLFRQCSDADRRYIMQLVQKVAAVDEPRDADRERTDYADSLRLIG